MLPGIGRQLPRHSSGHGRIPQTWATPYSGETFSARVKVPVQPAHERLTVVGVGLLSPNPPMDRDGRGEDIGGGERK